MIAVLEVEDPAFIREAARRGVFAYLADGEAEELESALEIVLERFAEFRNLEGAFGRRAVTERAKGILMERHRVDEQRAFELLRSQSRNTGRKLVEVAAAVVDGYLLLPAREREPAHEERGAAGRLTRLAVAAADRLAELAPLEEQAAACALGRDHARAGEQRLEQHDPENGVPDHELARSYWRYRHEQGNLMPWTGDLARRLAVARGDEPADLVVRGGRVLSVFTREWLDVDVAICDGVIAGLGEYEGAETLDADGAYVVPGFIDAHMHLETSKLLPSEFARLVLPLGTTAVVADPHEIANVLGTDGVHWLVDVCEDLPLDVFFTASSCVPASGFESPRRPFTPGDLESLLRRKRVIGLAEMMNFPGVISGAASELAKLAVEGADRVDGHAPGVLGHALQAYAAAGIGSDHEAFTAEEGRERLRAGMWLLIREASAARNLRALVPLVAEFGPSRMAFCTDDREPEHIAEDGHINAMVRDAVAYGVAPEDALVMASHHPALWHGLGDSRRDRSRLPGRPAAASRPRALRARDRARSAAARWRRSRRRRCRSG